jgi:hypothetical protein
VGKSQDVPLGGDASSGHTGPFRRFFDAVVAPDFGLTSPRGPSYCCRAALPKRVFVSVELSFHGAVRAIQADLIKNNGNPGNL